MQKNTSDNIFFLCICFFRQGSMRELNDVHVPEGEHCTCACFPHGTCSACCIAQWELRTRQRVQAGDPGVFCSRKKVPAVASAIRVSLSGWRKKKGKTIC
jgi:hypothetical protein